MEKNLNSFDSNKLREMAIGMQYFSDEMRFFLAQSWARNFDTIKKMPAAYSDLDQDKKMEVVTNFVKYLGSLKSKITTEVEERFKPIQSKFNEVKQNSASELSFENFSFFMGNGSDLQTSVNQMLSSISECGAQFSGQLKKTITGKLKLSGNELDAAKTAVMITNLENSLFELEHSIKEIYSAFENDVINLKNRGFNNVDIGKVSTPLRDRKDAEANARLGKNRTFIASFEEKFVEPYMKQKLQKEAEEIKKHNANDDKLTEKLQEMLDGASHEKPSGEAPSKSEEPFIKEGEELSDDIFDMGDSKDLSDDTFNMNGSAASGVNIPEIIGKLSGTISEQDVLDLSNSIDACGQLKEIGQKGVYERDGEKIKLTPNQCMAITKILERVEEFKKNKQSAAGSKESGKQSGISSEISGQWRE